MAWFSRFNRSTRLVAVGGLALGIGFGAMAIVTAATSPSPSPGQGAHSAPDANGAPGQQPHHRGHRGFFGGSGGTITAINGGTLTLRTEEGTETVTTSSSTQFRRLRQTIQLSELHVGDVVHVRPAQGSTPPPTPGTGTIAAENVTVVEPTVAGRVTSIDGDTVNLVGRDGRLLTVTLTPSTRYYDGKQAADRSAVVANSHIMAEGDRDSLTHLTADLVTVLPAPSAGGGARTRGMAIEEGLPGPADLAPGGLPAPPEGADQV